MHTVGGQGWLAGLGDSGRDETWWLDVEPSRRFQPLVRNRYSDRDSYRLDVVPYLEDRGAGAPSLIDDLVRIDLTNLAQAFTILFEFDHGLVLRRMMPEHLYTVIRNVSSYIDHVGREIVGPLDFYLQLLADIAPDCGLSHHRLDSGRGVTADGNAVFPSVQVVEALRVVDPDVAGVTIGKTVFTDEKGVAGQRGCVELFQPALRDGSAAQSYKMSLERLANLRADAGTAGTRAPICHISVRAADVATVHDLHRVAREDESGLVRLYLDDVVENAGDNSTITKILIRDRADGRIYNKVLEVVHRD